jgi:hypothetical protein
VAQLKPTKTVYTVSDFLDWQRAGTLRLKPVFQRREVWTPKAKSLLIDTVVKGLPVPIIFLRKNQDLKRLSSTLEVVDGQQRLRTLFSFIDPRVLNDFDLEKDGFSVLTIHNPEIADAPFKKLPKDTQASILGYEISTHVLPPDTADEIVLRIFARLNSTGAKLNHQELRNAEYFGVFKTLVYELAVKNLPLWRRWQVFDDDDFARMAEVEAVSDYVAAIIGGIQGKTQPRLTALYKQYDDRLDGATVIAARFQKVMEEIDDRLGTELHKSKVKRQALFYSLFTACYDHMFGLGSDYSKRKPAKFLPLGVPRRFEQMNLRIVAGKVRTEVLDAMERATADKGRRDTRHRFFMESLGLASAR